MTLFKGYALSRGKTPIQKLKGGDYLKEPPENHDYVGILKDDIIQIDFDDEEDAKLALEIVKDKKLHCSVLKTSRGIHLYFKNDSFTKKQGVGMYLACGLRADIGLGSRIRAVPLKTTNDIETKTIVNGEERVKIIKKTVEREWLHFYDEVQTIPPYFRPLDKVNRNFKRSDTRNHDLFTYIVTLQSRSFSKSEVRKTIKVINDYIVYEPLDDKEIDIITRDDAFKEDLFYENNTFLFDRFGDYLLANNNVVLIGDIPHIYTKDMIYSAKQDDFERAMLYKINRLRDAQRKEVYKYMQLKIEKQSEYADPRFFGMKSNILDIKDMSFIDYNPKYVINNKVDYDYDENSYHEVMDKTLDKISCNDPEIRQLILEMIGYTLYRKNSMQVAFILTGEGANGKSTFLNMIKKLIGKRNYTSLDMHELEDTFKPSQLQGKLVNIGDDISAKYMESSAIFKKVVTGESFIAQYKYGQPFELENYSTQIFCANELPRVRDMSHGFSRRLKIVPFMAKFSSTDEDYDPFIEDKLLSDDAMEYLLKLAIEAFREVLIKREFTTSHVGEHEKHVYMVANNNVLQWLEESEPKLNNESIAEIYTQYGVWCRLNGNHPVSKNNLGKEIKKLGYKSSITRVDGKSVRIYKK